MATSPQSNNAFIGLPLITLQSLQTQYAQCLADIATAGKSYSIAGRSYTRADLSDVKETLSEINQAILAASPATAGAQFAYPRFW